MVNKIVNILPDKDPAPPVKVGDIIPTQRVINTDEMLQTLFRTNNNMADISEALKSTVDRINAGTSLDNAEKGTQAFSQDREALKHNFLLRGYFRKLEKQQKKQAREIRRGD